jgi:hypothetical protein
MTTNVSAPTTGDLLTVPSGVTRLSYFYGQLLTQRDLSAEQRYHLELRRLLQREAFGTGTVAGLRVDDAGGVTPGSVVVRPGLALDPDGRELLLLDDVCVAVVDPASTPSTTPYVSAPDLQDMAPQVSKAWGAAFGVNDLFAADDPASLWRRLAAVGLTEIAGDSPASGFAGLAAQLNKLTIPSGFSLPPGQLLRDVLFDALVGTTHIGLRYVERGAEPSPTVLDASCCGDTTCFPSRREEGVVIVARATPFDAVADPYREARASLEECFLNEETLSPPVSPPSPHPHLHPRKCLCEYLLGAWRGLPNDDPCRSPAPSLPVVPIARVYWSRFPRENAGQSRVLSVDNCCRPLAPGVPPVRALFDVLTQGSPVALIAPRFDATTPVNHGPLTIDPSGLTARVTARSTARLAPIPATTWEVYFYPASPATIPVAPIFWNSAHPPASFTIAIGSVPVPSPTDPTVSVDAVQLTFAGANNGPLNLARGTYLWRLNVDAGIQASQTLTVVEGVFEAVFFVP